ncbi:MAG TPA: type III pantothenate kinase [Chitinophagaceae bacterium]|nr:type III pantothenate kinase [Chitinophagaceae bacterium]
MNKTLCLDFGNTRQKAALFEGGQLQATRVLAEPLAGSLEQLLGEWQPEASILSSVIHHPAEAEEVLRARTSFHLLSNTSRLPFTLPVGKPETMGADRLALAAAAVHFFPGKNNLAIGLGSCITFNFINKAGEFLGGSISPGMEMRFRAMHQFTARLPLVKGDWNVPLIGYDTATNLQSGVVLGMACEIDGIVERYAERYGNFNVLLTGGDLGYFEPHLKSKIFADPDLIFKGLYAISQTNRTA